VSLASVLTRSSGCIICESVALRQTCGHAHAACVRVRVSSVLYFPVWQILKNQLSTPQTASRSGLWTPRILTCSLDTESVTFHIYTESVTSQGSGVAQTSGRYIHMVLKERDKDNLKLAEPIELLRW